MRIRDRRLTGVMDSKTPAARPSSEGAGSSRAQVAGTHELTWGTLQPAPALAAVFRRIRDQLATMDRNVNRDEEFLPDVSLLVLLKILKEQSHRSTPREPLAIRVGADPTATTRRVRYLL